MPAEFLTSNHLNSALEDLFESAEERLILISPYIALHDRYASVLKPRIADHRLAITLVFGKNEEDPSRSMKIKDLEFFMQFPNIEIRFERRLHAKYYANETTAIITSMNLYQYSQDNNIEAGVKMAAASRVERMMGANTIDVEAWNYFNRVMEQADLIFEQRPTFEKGLLGLSQKYVGSEILEDRVEEFFSPNKRSNGPLKARKSTTPKDQVANTNNNGYCIRTGAAIPFNVERPFSTAGYNSWSRYKNKEYAEKFCHFSGEASNGETSFSRPILKKNWKKAKEAHKF